MPAHALRCGCAGRTTCFTLKLYKMKHPAKVDVAVLMLFFNRPDSLQKVFNEVKKARPARLFLYQDGPRNENDMEGIMACRHIVEEIDWVCDVHRLYQNRNYGCDPSGFMSQKWAFSLADKCIVLEDDVVPSQSFFTFCKELLDRYEHDERITMIAGFNTDEQTPGVPYDYFFTSIFSIWGWASWRRVVDKWDEHYAFLDNPFTVQQLTDIVKQRRYRADFLQMCRDHKANGKPYFESIFWSTMLLGSGLAVMPTQNLINNIGATDDSTHYSAFRTMPKRLRQLFTMQRFELSFPLRHPEYIIEYLPYKAHFYRAFAWGHPLIKVGRSIEELLLNLRYGNFRQIRKSLNRRIRKWLGLHRHV